MKTRSKAWAILAAAALSVGVVGIAMAIPLKDVHQGIVVGWDVNGDPEVTGFEKVNDEADCANEDLGAGEILFHFIWNQNDGEDTAGAEGTNLLDVDFTGAPDQDDVPDIKTNPQFTTVGWNVYVTSDGGDVRLDNAWFDAVDDTDTELRVSHICVGDEPDNESEPPSLPPSDSPAPSFTDEPGDFTEPPSDAFGAKDSSNPADGAWLLVVALGVLLASIVVLTPARAKSRR